MITTPMNMGQVTMPVMPTVNKVVYAVLDIETGNPKNLQEVVDQQMQAWEQPGNISKVETIEARRIEQREKLLTRGALSDAAPILCICLATEQGRVAFDGMSTEGAPIEGWTVIPCGDEVTMLTQFRAWVNYYCGDASTLVGHNALGFDFPKLRVRYLVNRLRLPRVLQRHAPKDEQENQPVYDTMKMFTRYYSQEHGGNPYASLDAVCTSLDIPRPKSVVSGAEVPAMFEAGQYAEILTYCAIDVAATERAYLLMTGQDNGMQ